jgi:hypothetical protein
LLKNIASTACRAVWGAAWASADWRADRLVTTNALLNIMTRSLLVPIITALPIYWLIIAAWLELRQLHK